MHVTRFNLIFLPFTCSISSYSTGVPSLGFFLSCLCMGISPLPWGLSSSLHTSVLPLFLYPATEATIPYCLDPVGYPSEDHLLWASASHAAGDHIPSSSFLCSSHFQSEGNTVSQEQMLARQTWLPTILGSASLMTLGKSLDLLWFQVPSSFVKLKIYIKYV